MKLVSIDLYNGKRLYVIKNARTERQDEILDNNTYIVWDLYPVAIWDYVDKDWSDKQGWLQEMEDGEVVGGMEQILQYPLTESLEDVFEEEGYRIEDVDFVYAIEYMSDDPKAEKITIEKAVRNAF